MNGPKANGMILAPVLELNPSFIQLMHFHVHNEELLSVLYFPASYKLTI